MASKVAIFGARPGRASAAHFKPARDRKRTLVYFPNHPTARKRITRMHCLTCGYMLDGLDQQRCPECGREFDENDASTFADRSPIDLKDLGRTGEPLGTLIGLAIAAAVLGVIVFTYASIARFLFLIALVPAAP